MVPRLLRRGTWPNRWLFISILFLLAVALFLLLAKRQIDRYNNGSEHILLQQNVDKWASQGASNYTVVLNSTWLPVPPTIVKIVVRDGKVVNQEPLYCEGLESEKALAQCRSTLLRGDPNEYTIEGLFGTARTCTTSTKTNLIKCDPATYGDFVGFTDSSTMIEVGDNCAKSVGRSERRDDHLDILVLCFVGYVPTYGYPKEIFWYLPQMTDGFGGISVESIQLNK